MVQANKTAKFKPHIMMKCTQRDYFTSMGNYSYLSAMVKRENLVKKHVLSNFHLQFSVVLLQMKGFKDLCDESICQKPNPFYQGACHQNIFVNKKEVVCQNLRPKFLICEPVFDKTDLEDRH